MPYQFQGQRQGEEVVLVMRQHPFVLLTPMLIAAAILLIPMAAYVLLPFGQAFDVVFVASVLASAGFAGSKLMAWWNSLFLLTSQRVVVVVQQGILRREMVECGLFSIQQVSHRVHGLLHTLFGYGTIEIQTAGSHLPFSIPNAPDAYEVQQEILRMAEAAADKH